MGLRVFVLQEYSFVDFRSSCACSTWWPKQRMSLARLVSLLLATIQKDQPKQVRRNDSAEQLEDLDILQVTGNLVPDHTTVRWSSREMITKEPVGGKLGISSRAGWKWFWFSDFYKRKDCLCWHLRKSA